MTVSELSERSGVPYSSIASWLGERASLPNIDTVCLIADTLDCSIDYLVGREDMNGTIISSGEHLSKDESAFWNCIANCPIDKNSQLSILLRECLRVEFSIELEKQNMDSFRDNLRELMASRSLTQKV